MGRAALRTAIASAALFGVAGACRQLVGIGDTPPEGSADATAVAEGSADAGTPSIVYAGALCENCLTTSCGALAQRCAGDPSCSMLEGCFGACQPGDVTCRARCAVASPVVADPAEDALAACLVASCSPQCGFLCGTAAELYGPDAAVACQDCLLGPACMSLTKCEGNAGCEALSWCLPNQYPDRKEACLDAVDAGDAGELEFDNAIAGFNGAACIGVCPLGNQWQCVGNPGAPAQAASTTMTLYLTDYVSGDAMAGASVAACRPIDGQCSPAFTTDDAGVATVTITGNNAGPTGYLGVGGQSVYPTLVFWGFPLSEPTFRFHTKGFTTSDVSDIVGKLAELGVTTDPDDAVVAMYAYDCSGNASPGVTFSLSTDAGAQLVYLHDGIPSPTGPTDTSGAAAAVNVAPGTLTITATPAALGHPSSILPVTTQAGTITVVQLGPNQ